MPGSFSTDELAAFLHALADRIKAGEVRPGELAGMLRSHDDRPAVDRAADYIERAAAADVPAIGKDVAAAVGVTIEAFKSHLVPKLKARGFVNRLDGNGYRPPPR